VQGRRSRSAGTFSCLRLGSAAVGPSSLPDPRSCPVRSAGGGGWLAYRTGTVVLDAGQGMFSPAFAWLQAALAEHATVVAYDRPGYGWSTPVDRPVDATATADDLREALGSRSLEGPYLLVGHSLGAFYVRTFAARYPEQTPGARPVRPCPRAAARAAARRCPRRVRTVRPAVPLGRPHGQAGPVPAQ
jgi:pimeloyl-ACP methyl ester carboxylesterase